jgi:seryl-tRNA synthetase
MRFTVELNPPAHEMAREEIDKQLAFLGKDIRISASGDRIEFDALPEIGPALLAKVEAHARRIERVLRDVPRKVIFRSAAADHLSFAEPVDLTGVRVLGVGWVALQGIPLHLFRYFDRVFESLGSRWFAQALSAPSLISEHLLVRAGYFRSFPHHVTFASHLKQDIEVMDSFRERQDTPDLEIPGACLSPAVCYHVYSLFQNQAVPASGAVFNICGKCYRREAGDTSDLRRLWEFTMRELVFLGSSATVLAGRDQSIAAISELLDLHQLGGEIRTASDPFFLSPDAMAKTYYQLKSDSKFEVSLYLPEGERLAVGSLNYHSDFFGRAFDVRLEGGGPMHSACAAFGLERWVYAFLAQHGSDPKRWPDVVRTAPEFGDVD